MRARMRGSSAAALDQVLAAVEAAQSPGKIAGELFAAVKAIDGSPPLRRVLTDPSTEVIAKQDLTTEVFSRALSQETLAVLATAVAGRWSSPRDLTDGLEAAGVAAHVAAADQASELDAVENDLFSIGQVISSSGGLRAVMLDRSVPSDAKASLLDTLFAGKVTSESLALAKQAAVARAGSFEKALAAFGTIAADRRNRLIAEVRVANRLDQDQGQRLADALARKYGREVHLNTVVDPSVVGGIAVSVGDEVVDGTMSTRLESARRQLAG